MLRAIIFIILIAMPTVSVASERNSEIEYRFNFESDDGAYVFEIINSPKLNVAKAYPAPRNVTSKYQQSQIRIADRIVRIECLNECKCKDIYEEKLGSASGWPVGSGLIGVFLVEDESRHLVTTWSAATSYNVDIYGCENGRMGKVLDINSRTIPNIYPDDNGMPVIKYSPDYDHPNSTATLHWNGASYSAD